MARASKPDDIPYSTIAHFDAIPWCSTMLDDPDYSILSLSRTVTQPGSGHSLFGGTLNTPDTITELLSLYRPLNLSEKKSAEIRRFYTFGSGMNAHPNLLHGGIIATILDSTMSNMGGLATAQGLKKRDSVFTVGLNISYKKPIPTPSTILAKAWISKVEGRKVWVEGSLESGTGEVYAKAEGVWLKAVAMM